MAPKGGAGKIQPFDPKAFDKMRGDIKQQQTQQARIAARTPKPAPGPAPKDQMKLTEKDVFGLRARRDYANRLMNKGKL